jgi:sn-glycerol 3-phosphate transport system ATP-binding protein
MAAIALEQINKTYPNGHAAVRGVTLDVRDGEFMVLVGPSGCGKSTLLRLVAGLETPETGRIRLDADDVTLFGPQQRDLAMVFQSYALYPHMSVRDNLAYGLRVRGTQAAAIRTRIAAVAEALEIEALLDRRPSQLSGGQRQRVALGRAMVREPKAFLFDEPLSNLDPSLRAQARAELLRLHRRLKTTIVYVTHDQEEAMTLADRVAVMRAGAIEQVAAPLDVYARPANTFVAGFIGSPPMNLLPAPLPGVTAPADAMIGVRPHDIVIGRGGALRATVDLVEPRGHDAVVHLTLQGDTPGELVAVVSANQAPSSGEEVTVALGKDAVHLFDTASGARIDS